MHGHRWIERCVNQRRGFADRHHVRAALDQRGRERAEVAAFEPSAQNDHQSGPDALNRAKR